MALTKVSYSMIDGPYVNVTDYGVVGDGSTDDSDALQACFTDATSKGLSVIFSPSDNVKITKTLTQDCPVIGNGATINIYIANAATYPYAFNCSADITDLNFTGVNSVAGVGAIKMYASNKIISFCSFASIPGNAFRSPSGFVGNTITQCSLNICGRYSDFSSMYIHTKTKVIDNTITNSPSKGIEVGESGTENQIIGNVVTDVATAPTAQEAIYSGWYTSKTTIQNNTIRRVSSGAAAIKISRQSTDCSVIGNAIEGTQGIFSQGGVNNSIVGNRTPNISVNSHSDGFTILPDTGCNIIGNAVFGVIDLGNVGSGDVNETYVVGNNCTIISGLYSSHYGTYIASNVCEGINFLIDNSVSTASIRPLTIKNNTVTRFASGTGITARGVDLFDPFEADTIVIEGNYVRGPGASTGGTIGIYSIGVEKLSTSNNVVESVETGFLVNRVKTLKFENNVSVTDVGTGYSLSDSDSATYWPGTGNDYIINNNLGTYVSVASSRVFFYLAEKDKYASAAPTTGYHLVGEYRINTVPTAGGFWGFVCVTAGSPGTWKTFAAISA
jgi:hypothetical protein